MKARSDVLFFPFSYICNLGLNDVMSVECRKGSNWPCIKKDNNLDKLRSTKCRDDWDDLFDL
jgi:hypothetical protein